MQRSSEAGPDRYLVDVSLFAWRAIDLAKLIQPPSEMFAAIPASLGEMAVREPSRLTDLLQAYSPAAPREDLDGVTSLLRERREHFLQYVVSNASKNHFLRRAQFSREEVAVAAQDEFERFGLIEPTPLQVEYFVEVMHALEVGLAESPAVPFSLVALTRPPASEGIRGTLGVIGRVRRSVLFTLPRKGQRAFSTWIRRYSNRKKRFWRTFRRKDWRSYFKDQAVSFLIAVALGPATLGVSILAEPLVYTGVYFAVDGFSMTGPGFPKIKLVFSNDAVPQVQGFILRRGVDGKGIWTLEIEHADGSMARYENVLKWNYCP